MTKKQAMKHLEEFLKCFTYNKEREIYHFSDEALKKELSLKWKYSVLSEVIHNSETDEDTAYAEAYYCLDHLHSMIVSHGFDSVEDMEKWEYLDGITDEAYTSNLTEWLHRSSYNVAWLTEALGHEQKDGSQLLSLAHHFAQVSIWQSTFDAVIDYLKEA